jgi:hypothetical protein
MTIPIPLLGLGALVIGLLIAIVAPPGRRGQWAFVMSIVVFCLFLLASFCLWPIDPNHSWNWLLPGIIGGVLAVIILDIRRWARYFQNLTHRMRSPYYWYSRMASRRRRRY